MKTYNCLFCNIEGSISGNRKNKYCSIKCQKDFEYTEYINSWKLGTVDGSKGQDQTSGYIHRYIREKFNYTFTSCKNAEWLGEPISLDLEHIDGNGSNNIEENLTILCPNCHSKTPTYKSKNKGNGRKNRKYS